MPTSTKPSLVNTCTDVGDSVTVNTQIKNFCAQLGTTSIITNACQKYGGTNSSGGNVPGGVNVFENPEWDYGKDGNVDDCQYDDCNTDLGYIMSSGGCGGAAGGGCCGIEGKYGYCTRKMNSGDPLVCSLRDYQCNGDNKISDSSCFSDNNLNSTCNKDFRAPDTLPSNYLLNQFCLNNIPGAIQGFTGTGADFLQLWTNVTNEQGNNWTVTGLPSGSSYRTSADIEADNTCQYNNNGTPSNCQLSTWAVGQPEGPIGALPSPDAYIFTDSLPPCQQIFWRTLYGNQPTFQNNYYAPFGVQSNCPDGSNICDNTSIPPQQAACAALQFQGTPTPAGFQNAKFLLNQAVAKYYNNNGDLLNNNTQINPAFREFVFGVCSAYPGLCTDFIKNKVCNNIDGTNVTESIETVQWCGCNMDPGVYTEYADNFGVSRQCTPYCNIPKVIPYIDPDTETPLYCDQSICMIDNVTMNLAKTRVLSEGTNGDINFSQICNSCSATGNNGTNSNTVSNSNSVNSNTNYEDNSRSLATINCQCVLNGFTLTTIGATIEGGVNISQACNGNAKCYSNGSNLDGSTLEVDCKGSTTSQNTVIAKAEAALLKKSNSISNYWVIIIFVIFIALLIIAWLFIAPRGVPESDLIFTKRFDIPPPPVNPVTYNPMTIYTSSLKPKTKFY
jgi:hypothetical protein